VYVCVCARVCMYLQVYTPIKWY